MKTPFRFLAAAVSLLRILGLIQIIVGLYFLFFNIMLGEYVFWWIVISAVFTFVFAELILLFMDMSESMRKTVNQLEIIATSLHERDKLIMKMMGIIVEQMKNK
jgi:hypothetical protein